MNEKFFDLRKEKQNRMINAGLHIFALNGYHHASTDEIVKEAGISKGLLFHYFGSKAGYYAFLYSYINRYALLEYSSEIRDGRRDLFTLHRDLLRVEAGLMEQYPYLFLYLESLRSETDPEALASLDELDRSVPEFYHDVLQQADATPYLRIDNEARLDDIIHYIKIGLMRERLQGSGTQIADYAKVMDRYLTSLQRMASKL